MATGKLAKNAFGVAAQAIIEQFIYAKLPPHLKKSINRAHLENGRNEKIVSHLEKELELNGLEAPDELHINTVTQQTTQHTTKPRKTQTNLLPQQKAKSLPKLVPPTRMRKKPVPKQHD